MFYDVLPAEPSGSSPERTPSSSRSLRTLAFPQFSCRQEPGSTGGVLKQREVTPAGESPELRGGDPLESEGPCLSVCFRRDDERSRRSRLFYPASKRRRPSRTRVEVKVGVNICGAPAFDETTRVSFETRLSRLVYTLFCGRARWGAANVTSSSSPLWAALYFFFLRGLFFLRLDRDSSLPV